MPNDISLFDRVGGTVTLNRVHSNLYGKIYAHPWIGRYFAGKPRWLQERQQTSFMMKLMGGEVRYLGKTPRSAHQHMMITDELFALRQKLLNAALIEEGITEALRKEWLAVDATMKPAIVKKSLSDCDVSYAEQPILDFKNPLAPSGYKSRSA